MIDYILVPLVVAGLAVNGLRLRSRVPDALPAYDPPAAPPAEHGPAPGDWAWITARETTLDETTRRDAVGCATTEGLRLVDLVPADLPATAARDLLRRVDPKAYRSDVLAVGHSAGAAIMADPELLERAQVTQPPEPEPADLMSLARQLRPYAGRDAAFKVAPALRSDGDDLARRKARLRANGNIVSLHIALELVPFALTAIALIAGWEWGLAAVAGYCLQPYLIFAGTALAPRGLHAAALGRPVHDPYIWARTAAGRWRSAADREREEQEAAAATYYRTALAAGTGRFFEPRRRTCPWCGGGELTVRLRSPDFFKHKPGTFTLDRCGGCGHIFQNPRLTSQGLDFYYRDFYDGLGADAAEMMFLTGVNDYRGRARLVQSFTTPKSWLDVGAGHGHFCAVAREFLPDTVFDGLDQGAVIEDAERRGWITTAYRGSFPELADQVAGRYDVVSMHHYLEHTREPLAELDAAARLLPAGSYLLIELPDPQWRLSRLFGRYWMGWFQPQHLHMMPIGNLSAELERRGLRTVAVERGSAHQANDTVLAVFWFITSIAPDRSQPWSPRPATTLTRAWRQLLLTVGLAFLGAALLADRTLCRALARHWDRANVYRVLARKEDAPHGN
jgi:hypothetical protein